MQEVVQQDIMMNLALWLMEVILSVASLASYMYMYEC